MQGDQTCQKQKILSTLPTRRMVKVVAVLNHNQRAIWIHRLRTPDPRMYQTVKAAAGSEAQRQGQSQTLQQLNSVSTDYAHLRNLWFTTSGAESTLSPLPSNRACSHQSRNSTGAFLQSKFHLPASTILPAIPERALKNPAARGKLPRTAESSDGRPQAETDRA